jgi:uncharacterized protein involved in outer membrane biogenesis
MRSSKAISRRQQLRWRNFTFQPSNASSLHHHVSFQKLDALERGQMMPAQKDFTEAEALDLSALVSMAVQKKPQIYPHSRSN